MGGSAILIIATLIGVLIGLGAWFVDWVRGQ